MSSLPLCLVSEGNSGTGVDYGGLLEDKSVTLETSNVTTRVSEGDLVNLVGIKPDFTLSAFENGSSKTLLKLEGYCHGRKENVRYIACNGSSYSSAARSMPWRRLPGLYVHMR
jgi:hypothetical protein